MKAMVFEARDQPVRPMHDSFFARLPLDQPRPAHPASQDPWPSSRGVECGYIMHRPLPRVPGLQQAPCIGRRPLATAHVQGRFPCSGLLSTTGILSRAWDPNSQREADDGRRSCAPARASKSSCRRITVLITRAPDLSSCDLVVLGRHNSNHMTRLAAMETACRACTGP